MGQTIGRAPLTPGAQHFTNLPKSIIYELWEAFNDIAEGFGLGLDEFLEILRVCLKDYLEYTEKKLDQIGKAVFTTLDDDANDLVDALEFLSTFAVISGMTPTEKIRYIFGIFDFDESGVLSVDEMILCMRTTVAGLCKISAIDTPLEADIEHIAIQAFGDLKSIEGSMITRAKFITFCMSSPEVSSWLEYYGDMDEFGNEVLNAGDKLCDLLVTHGSRVIERSLNEYASMDIDTGGKVAAKIEDRGFAKNICQAQPWQALVPFLEPSGAPRIPDSAPDVHLSLEWVYGYNAKVSRQSVCYSGRGQVVYPAGALGVVYDIATSKQQFMNAHTDVITCLRAKVLHNKSTLVATGEAGQMPKIIVWTTGGIEPGSVPEVLKVLKGFHRNGVSQVAWSLDGELLLTVGATGFHCVGVYSWKTSNLVFTSQASEQPILDACWVAPDQFVTCGVNHVYFWSKHGEFAYKRQRGLFGRKSSPQPILCAKPFGTVVLTGCSSGHLAVWEGRNCIRSMKAHSGAITALYVLGVKDATQAAAGTSAGLITGSTDGKIQCWNSQLEATAAFDLAALGGISKIVQSLSWDDTNHKILVGSWSSEIYEMHDAEGYDMHDGPLVQGHYEHRVFGLCVSPTELNEFATVGEDRTVRVWDMAKHVVKALVTLDTMGHCITFSPDGDMLAVGLGYAPGGHGLRQRKDGAFVILSRKDLTIIHEGRDSKQLISCISFSPDGGSLAVGSYDRSIYLYNTTDWASIGKCRGHKGRVTHLDFSCDNKNIQSVDDVGELLFWETSTAEQRTARSMKDTAWQTQTCTLGWALQGTLGVYDDGSVVNCAGRSAGGTVLITADNFSRLRCWRYPAASTDFPAYAEYRGHGGGISSCCFVSDDSYILTTGEQDNCVMQWRFMLEGPPLDEPSITIDLDGVQRNDLKDFKSYDRSPETEAANLDDRTKIFLMEERGGESDFTPVRPWQRTVVAPTRPPPERIDEPCDSLRLCWVHGFRAGDVKNGVKYTKTGEIVFFSGSVNVVLDVRSQTQIYHRDHTDEIMSIAVHPTRTLIATSDQAKVPTILLWDYEGAMKGGSCPTAVTLSGQHRRGISHMAFSPCGKWLATVGLDDLHSLVVYDWQNQTVRCRRTTPKEKTFDIQFPPTTSDGVVQVGVGFIRFWKMDGRNMTWKSATLGTTGQWQTFTAVGFVGNRTVVGCQDGSLYLFAGSTLERSVRGHEGPVNVISSTNEGCATGGHDGFVKVWNTVLEENMVVHLGTMGSVSPTVRSIQWENEQNKIVVGTLGAEIFELDAVDGSNLKEDGGPRVQGHSHVGEEMWALSAHPFYPRFATAGDDATLRVWDVGTKHEIRSVTALEMPARCLAYSPKGERIAVGFGAPIKKSAMQFDGKFVVLSSSDFAVLHEGRDSQKYLTEVKWSPTGALLAFGSFDTKIYVYDCESSYTLVAVCAQHNAVIRGFDFSSDGEYLMTNCGAFELGFFESGTGMAVPAASKLKDTRWHSCTASMQWSTQGCWSPQADRCDIITCDANLTNEHGNVVIATGDNYGRIRLFRYPCDTALAQAKLYRGHGGASPISKVRWVAGDQYLVSVSAKERNIMVWMHDADDAAANDAREAQVMDLDPDLKALALGDEANLALSEVRDPLAEEMAVEQQSAKPWLSAIVEPTDGPSSDTSPPDVIASLQCCFGIQVSCARSALAYNSLGDVVWPTANVCVVYTKESHHQKVFAGHASEVTAFAISNDGRYVASGERGNRPQVRIWDAQTCLEIGSLPPFHRNAVSCLAWSHDGKRLATVGCDVEHSVAVYESSSGLWTDARKLAYSPGDHRAVHFVCFLDPAEWGPGESVAPVNTAGSDGPKHPGFLFATGGIDHVKFWTLEGRTLTPTRGIWGDEAKVQPLLCGCCVGRTLVTGSISGHLYVWKGRTCERVIRAHETMVISLWSSPAGVVSGGGDGMVKLYNARLEHERSFALAEAPTPPLVPVVKAVCGGLDRTGKVITKILVSTASSECYELAKDSGSWTLLAEGHYSSQSDGASGELWGLAPHPTKPDIIATTGDDGTVRIWSVSQSRLLRKCQLDSSARAIAWSPSGRRLLVGLGGSSRGLRQKKDGAFVLLDADTLDLLFEGRDSRHWIHDAKFSPEGDTFVLASQDQKLYLYDSKQNVLRAKCDKHNDAVLHVDFSEDGAFIQSDSADYEHLYYSSSDGAYFKLPSQLKNVHWETWTCKMGWPVQGCWPKPLSGKKKDDAFALAALEGKTGAAAIAPEPTSVHRSNNGELIAAGYQDGRVRIYRYPCLSKKAEFVELKGHSADLPSIRFTCDDKHLITIGRTDRTVFVWKLDRKL